MNIRSRHWLLVIGVAAILSVGLGSCKEDMKRLAVFHEAHEEIDCDSCHEEVDVMEMTASKPSAETCAFCHEGVAPNSHKVNWDVLHGEESKFTSGTCSYCHEQSECTMCHQVTEPKDHNTFWRRRAHGLEAEWDRSRCMVCHQEDFCIRCHSETKPFSHTAMWAGRQNAHCRFCHIPASGVENCSVCHTDISFEENHIYPAPGGVAHSPGSLCIDCHRPGAGLKHFSTEENCEICHLQ